MYHIGLPELLAILLVLAVMFHGDSARRLAEAISRFKGGGPGSPSHPIPADDSRILIRRRKPQESHK